MAQARNALGWSQTDLAQALKTNRGQVGHWETGFRRPGLDAVILAVAVLQVDFDWLATGRGQPEPTPRHHAGLFRACWGVVAEWLRDHPDARADTDPCGLVLAIYAKAAAAGLDQSPADDSTLPGQVAKLATF